MRELVSFLHRHQKFDGIYILTRLSQQSQRCTMMQEAGCAAFIANAMRAHVSNVNFQLDACHLIIRLTQDATTIPAFVAAGCPSLVMRALRICSPDTPLRAGDVCSLMEIIHAGATLTQPRFACTRMPVISLLILSSSSALHLFIPNYPCPFRDKELPALLNHCDKVGVDHTEPIMHDADPLGESPFAERDGPYPLVHIIAHGHSHPREFAEALIRRLAKEGARVLCLSICSGLDIACAGAELIEYIVFWPASVSGSVAAQFAQSFWAHLLPTADAVRAFDFAQEAILRAFRVATDELKGAAQLSGYAPPSLPSLLIHGHVYQTNIEPACALSSESADPEAPPAYHEDCKEDRGSLQQNPITHRIHWEWPEALSPPRPSPEPEGNDLRHPGHLNTVLFTYLCFLFCFKGSFFHSRWSFGIFSV